MFDGSVDIGPILRYWEYLYTEMVVRLSIGETEIPELCLSLGGGEIYMHTEGRPDGITPFGFESYREVVCRKQELTDMESALSDEDLAMIQQELILYNARSLAFLKLKDYYKSHCDAIHNLNLLNMVLTRPVPEKHCQMFLYVRPHLIMVYQRVLSLQSIDNGQYRDALRYLSEGVKKIKAITLDWFQNKDEALFAINLLEKWRSKIEQKDPRIKLESLNQKLVEAIEEEDYESAVWIRNQIRTLDTARHV